MTCVFNLARPPEKWYPAKNGAWAWSEWTKEAKSEPGSLISCWLYIFRLLLTHLAEAEAAIIFLRISLLILSAARWLWPTDLLKTRNQNRNYKLNNNKTYLNIYADFVRFKFESQDKEGFQLADDDLTILFAWRTTSGISVTRRIVLARALMDKGRHWPGRPSNGLRRGKRFLEWRTISRNGKSVIEHCWSWETNLFPSAAFTARSVFCSCSKKRLHDFALARNSET